ncbi:cytolytic toxin-alpha-like isoform X2 [Engraulis encrasicolus]|uniref:cytolytic toxin-alpha-like isoform X2 n=1 Tax=Engraulis encrasicolus TaxID=184585 RepID=UPI002FD29910
MDIKMDLSQEHAILNISALGRPLDLGTLYNARTDQLIPGITLWSTEDMAKRTVVSPQPYTKFEFSSSESLRDKMKLLDVSASVKASFFCGLVEVGGSAKFLNQQTCSAQQCSVTLKYHVTTVFKELMMSELSAPTLEAVKKTDATHVVSQVTYGAHALMEFENSVREEVSKRDVQLKLSQMVHQVPIIKVNSDGSLKMTEEDKDKVKDFRCHFFGDFRPTTLPLTFEEAVAVCKELPNLLGEHGEKAVPITVWLYPLSKLTGGESKLKRMISDMLVERLQLALDDLHQAEIRAHDLLEKSKAIKADDIVYKLESFQTSLKGFIPEFLRKMAVLIPAIRGGDLEDRALTDLLRSQHASGFGRAEMDRWLDGKETEIYVVTSHIRKLRSDIKPQGSELDCFLMDPDVSEAYVFCFTSLRYPEQYLQKISQASKNLHTSSKHHQEPSPQERKVSSHAARNNLNEQQPGQQSFQNGGSSTTSRSRSRSRSISAEQTRGLLVNTQEEEEEEEEEVAWYRRPEVKRALRSSIEVFNGSALEKKVISFIPDPEHPGAAVRWYRDAALEDPNITEAREETRRQDDSVIRLLTLL